MEPAKIHQFQNLEDIDVANLKFRHIDNTGTLRYIAPKVTLDDVRIKVTKIKMCNN